MLCNAEKTSTWSCEFNGRGRKTRWLSQLLALLAYLKVLWHFNYNFNMGNNYIVLTYFENKQISVIYI